MLDADTAFKEVRHVERVRNLLARLRRRLQDLGLPARFEAGSKAGTSRLVPGWDVTRRLRVSARAHASTPSGPSGARGVRGRRPFAITPRELEIAGVAEELGEFRFAAIAARFPVARQSLHAHLARLVEKGWLSHDRRGRASSYRWIRPRTG